MIRKKQIAIYKIYETRTEVKNVLESLLFVFFTPHL